MKRSIPLIPLIGILLMIFAVSCGDKSQTAQQDPSDSPAEANTLSPPESAWDIPFETHQLAADQPHEIEMESGSRIKIPAGTLVNARGEAAEGNISLSYREFHTAADIFRSGIPMRYDSAGSKHILRSAGMYELRAAQGEEPLFIAEGKSVEVDMASTQKGSYNFYKLNDTGNRNWTYMRTATAEAWDTSGEEHSDLGDIEIPAPWIKPEKADKDAAIFDFKANYQRYPELASYKDVLWQDAGISEEKVLNIAENEWIFGEIWKEADVSRARVVEGKYYYYLQLKNKRKEARLLVKPVLEGKAFRKALQSYRQNEAERSRLQQLYAQRAQQLAAQRAPNRFSSGITEFGVYNWDVIIKKGQLEVLAADFLLENGQRPEAVYLIVPDAPVALKFARNQWDTFTFSPHWKSLVVAVLPDKRLAILGDEDLKSQIQTGQRSAFVLKQARGMISPAEINRMLAP